MPIIAGMKLTPPISSTLPKVKRGWPAVMSIPMVAMNSPISSETKPFRVEPVEITTAQESPRQASQKYSKDENWIATSASARAVTASTSEPSRPPIAEHTRPVPSASSALPFEVSA